MRYWWVSQGRTYKEERAGGYLWAPKENENGQTYFYWENMAEVEPGDIEQPLAMYVPIDAEILIGPEIEVTSALGQSYLVHELVHAHQMESGVARRAPFPGWLESEAYRVQASYLRIRGLTKDAFEMEILGLLKSSCAQAYHPELILE